MHTNAANLLCWIQRPLATLFGKYRGLGKTMAKDFKSAGMLSALRLYICAFALKDFAETLLDSYST